MGAVFEWGVTFSATGLVIGIYLDGWAHIRGMPESFFTPWHALIYGSFGFAGLLLAGGWVSGSRRGHTWRTALPPGYGLSLVGAGIFLVSGVADLIWHAIFGIERATSKRCTARPTCCSLEEEH
jgi:hypothetical protein